MEYLPILEYENQIVDLIQKNQITIITAETGAGKSTQVPQFLLKRGMNVIVTEPRRLAARSLAERVSKENGSVLGEIIGYRTGFERCDSEETKCLFVTDGLELVREISGDWKPDVLIIDEVHEWNLNIETLVAWSKKRLADDAEFKVVIMSATLESNKLSKYYGDAPVVSVHGRLFDVTENKHEAFGIVEEVEQLIRDNKNTLVFQPGKSEIAKTIKDLEERKVSAVLLPLHGDLGPEEQDRVFQHYYSLPKVVVATNIAQTSITVDDIDAVVDSGLERRVETIYGIEGLYIRRTSQADDEQRKGRAGRCKSGIYINCYDGTEKAQSFPTAEIQRVRLDQLVLRLAIQGFDATELEFFHQPEKEMLKEAKRSLHALGAIDDQEKVTSIGYQMSKIPLSVQNSRMIVEAKKLDVLEDVITIAACLEVNGINSFRKDDILKWSGLSQEDESDLLFQRDLYWIADSKSSDIENLKKIGIVPKKFFKAREIRLKIIETLDYLAKNKGENLRLKSFADRQKIMRACISGMVDHLYRVCGIYGECRNGDNNERRMNKNSVANQVFVGRWIVGLPFDLEVKNKYGGHLTLYLVNMITKVDPVILTEIAPHLLKVEKKNWRLVRELASYNIAYDSVWVFNGTELPERKTTRVTWNDLPRHLTDGKNVQDIRREIISRQLEEKTSYGSDALYSSLIYSDNWDKLEWDRLKPTEFGIDPANGRKLEAYPTIVQDEDDKYWWEVKWFANAQEALLTLNNFKEKRPTLAEKISHLESELSLCAVDPEQTNSEWVKKEKRWWVCPNGHATRAAKNVTEIVCDVCGEIKQI